MKRLIVPAVIILASLLCLIKSGSSFTLRPDEPNALAIIGLSSGVSVAGTLGSIINKNRQLK